LGVSAISHHLIFFLHRHSCRCLDIHILGQINYMNLRWRKKGRTKRRP